jgi:hypothetical protein
VLVTLLGYYIGIDRSSSAWLYVILDPILTTLASFSLSADGLTEEYRALCSVLRFDPTCAPNSRHPRRVSPGDQTSHCVPPCLPLAVLFRARVA